MVNEFDVDRTYTKIMSKERLLKFIINCYDKEFVVSFLPRTRDNADILIRSLESQIKKSQKSTIVQEKK